MTKTKKLMKTIKKMTIAESDAMGEAWCTESVNNVHARSLYNVIALLQICAESLSLQIDPVAKSVSSVIRTFAIKELTKIEGDLIND